MVILIKTGVKNSSSQVRLDIRSDGGGEGATCVTPAPVQLLVLISPLVAAQKQL